MPDLRRRTLPAPSTVAIGVGMLWLIAGVTIVIMHDFRVHLLDSFLLIGSALVLVGGNEKILKGSKWRWIGRLVFVLLVWAAISSILRP